MGKQNASLGENVSIEPSDLAAVCGGELQNAANIGRGVFRWAGDVVGRFAPVDGPMTHFNNRGYQWGYGGEVLGRYVDKALGLQSDVGGTPAGSPQELSGSEGHMPSYGWKSL